MGKEKSNGKKEMSNGKTARIERRLKRDFNIVTVIAAISTIVFKLLGQDLLSRVAGFALCILVILYWICYLVLRKKY